ncbi:sugar transferase [Gangjinia marincola]|uniref:Sugar transferase n=2 Tax=Gangjinia marincola TaxID=578463 RepID=A0ABN1MDT4_9FLAO
MAGIFVLSPLMSLIFLIGLFKFRGKPFFKTARIGQYGKEFILIKFRIISGDEHIDHKAVNDISWYGKILHQSKLNELPQLCQVVMGSMSMVGPRPDVRGFADQLSGEERKILFLKPGVTGPATIKYKHELNILNQVENPEVYNREIIWPDKVRINLHYLLHWSLKLDCYYLIRTLA